MTFRSTHRIDAHIHVTLPRNFEALPKVPHLADIAPIPINELSAFMRRFAIDKAVVSTGPPGVFFCDQTQANELSRVLNEELAGVVTADQDSDARWYRDTLGHRYMEPTVSNECPDFPVFCTTTTCERSQDFAVAWESTGNNARMNHFAYFVESREELPRAADVLLTARSAGFEPNVVCESQDTGRIRAIVAAGLEIGVLPRSDALAPGPTVTTVEVEHDDFEHVISLVWRSGRRLSPAAQALRDSVTAGNL